MMVLARTDWTPIWAAGVAAVAAIVGVVAGGLIQAIVASRQMSQEAADREYRERRDAYVTLFIALEQLRAFADGRLESGLRGGSDTAQRKNAIDATVTAELFAPPEVWRQIEPYREAVVLRSNYFLPRGQGGSAGSRGKEIAARLLEIGGDTIEGFTSLEQTARDAARTDLRSMR